MNNSENQYPLNAKSYLNQLKILLENTNVEEIDNAVNLIIRVWKSGKQIITLGNGGSSMTALHMVTDWNKMIFLSSGIPFRGRTLVDNIGLIMAYGNDISFNDIFIEQLKNIMQPGDLVIAISGSGNSENVIRAVNYANENGAITIGLSGFTGGKLKQIAQHSVWVNINDMQLAEDIHAIFGHIVMQRICGVK
jgi:D-sedoheptulose 7-phosphate isomerase